MTFQNVSFDLERICDDITCINRVNGWREQHDLGIISNAIANRECSKKLLESIYSISIMSELMIPHPVIPGINTYPFFSRGFPNHSIFFVDEDLAFPWILLQVFNFIDLIITPNQALGLVNIPLLRNKDDLKSACEFGNSSLDLLRANPSLQKMRPQYRGLLLNADRPFHFLFDELLYFFLIRKEVTASFCPSFGQLAYVHDSSYGPKVNDKLAFSGFQDSIYLRLKGVGVHVQPYTANLYQSFSGMGCKLLQVNPSRTVPAIPKDSFVIWLGITGQKRAWIEQVDGYAAVIEYIGSLNEHVTVVIDGWTQPEGSNKLTSDDWDIAFKIIDKARFRSNTRFIVAIDMNYSQKIHICSKVDFFIANHGSGCIVPHILLRKTGILHSPYILNGPNDAMNFPDIRPNNAIRVPTDKVTLIGYSTKTTPQNCSYSISPEDIIELVMQSCFTSNIAQMDEGQTAEARQASDSACKQHASLLFKNTPSVARIMSSDGSRDWRVSIKDSNVIDVSIS